MALYPGAGKGGGTNEVDLPLNSAGPVPVVERVLSSQANSTTSTGGVGACPGATHVPVDDAWGYLEDATGRSSSEQCSSAHEEWSGDMSTPTQDSSEVKSTASSIETGHSTASSEAKHSTVSSNETSEIGPQPSSNSHPEKQPALIAMFRYATKHDTLLMLMGTVGAMADGVALPALLVLFADFLNNLGSLASLSLSGGGADVGTQVDVVKQEIASVLLRFVYVALVALVAAYTEVSCWTLAGERQSSRVRAAYLRALLNKDPSAFELPHRGSSSMATRVSADALDFHDSVAEKVGHFIANITRFVAGFVCAFLMTWQIALAMCAFIPVLAIPALLYAHLLRSLPQKEAQAYEEAGSMAEATLSSIRTVFAFCGQGQALQSYSAALDKTFASGRRQALTKGLALGLQGLLLGVWGFMFWFGGYLVVHHRSTGGSFCGAALAVIIGAIALGQAIPSIKTFSRGRAAAARMFPAIDEDAQRKRAQTKLTMLAKVQGHVAFQGVCFAYPSRPEALVLSGFCLDVPAGTSVALVGPSGSGKSTVIGLLEQFYQPLSGKILVDGHDVSTLHMHTLRQHMGLVSQEPALFATSIKENILYGTTGSLSSGDESATMELVEGAAKAANAYDFIMTLPHKFDTQVGERGVALSGGQKQRIAIARALLRHPAILLLDEATSALDSRSERVVQSALSAAAKGRTTLVVAHRLSTIRHADKIVVLKGGQVVESGTHESLLTQSEGRSEGLYATLVRMQMQGEDGEGTQAQPAVIGSSETTGSVMAEGEGQLSSRDSAAGEASDVAGSEDSCQDMSSHGTTAAAAHCCLQFTPKRLLGEMQTESERMLATQDQTQSSQQLREDDTSTSECKPDIQIPLDADRGSALSVEVSNPSPRQERSPGQWLGSNHSWRVMQLAQPEWHYALVGSIGGMCVGLINPAWAFMVAGIISVFFNPDPYYVEQQAKLYALVVVGVGVFAFVMNVAEHFCFGVTGERLTLRVRKRLFAVMLQQQVAWFDRKENSTGVLASKLCADASLVRSLVGDRICIVVQAVSGVGAALALGLVLQWKMTLVMLATFPVILISFLLQSKALKGFSEISAQAQAEASQVAQEALSQHRTVTALSAVDHAVGLYEKRLERTRTAAFAQSQIAGLGLGVAQFLLYGSYALALWYGAQLAINGESDPDKVLKVLLVVISVAVSIAEASSLAPDLARAGPAVASVLAILDSEDAAQTPTSTSSSPRSKEPQESEESAGSELGTVSGDVVFEGVDFAYPCRPQVLALDDFCLHVAAGQKVALVGQSGSGKSTVISLLQRFYNPLAGRILLDGKDIRSLDLWKLRRCLGLVQQEPVLFACSIRENILYGSTTQNTEAEKSMRRHMLTRGNSFNSRGKQVADSAHFMEAEVVEAAKAANAHEFISALPQGYDTLCGERGAQLSGGQKQRIAIARALLRDPAILLLDEATSALDSESEKIVQAALDRLMQSRTTITVAHRLSTVRSYNAIALMQYGRIVEQGTHEDLMYLQGSYHELAKSNS